MNLRKLATQTTDNDNTDQENSRESSQSFSSNNSNTNSSHESLLASQHSLPSNDHQSGSENNTPCVATSGVQSSAELETARATQEAMSTPLTIPHSGSVSTEASRDATSVRHSSRPPIQLLGRNDDTPKVLTSTIANQLRPLLPVQQRLAKTWRLVYSIDQHGISMNTMLDLCASEKAILLAIKDGKGRVFGAYLNEPIRLSPSFYGQGTCFLWKAFRSTPQARRKDAVKHFKYTGGNEYFILCDPDFVAIGGGRGKFGLWFKSDFLHGYSARCPTFNNEPLCLDPSNPKNADVDAQQEFTVGHLEVWAFNA
ncbi:oxidation resistance protein 1 [Coemansia sp. RSA 1358]|nr:oxidation resistance protein 1 [Coemansia umbellata]KAJ2621558.1 oxidation resistance protein 1 [Coemansia sp. RSA 1358]